MIRKWWLVCLVLVSLATDGAKSAPTIISSPETLAVNVGEVAVLRCRVHDLGNNTVIWRYVDHNVIISAAYTILAENKDKFSILPVPHVSEYNLQILYIKPSDQGFYECMVKDTYESMIIHVDVQNVNNFPINHNPAQILNVTDCCSAYNVSSICLPACVPDNIDHDTFDPLFACGNERDLLALSHCFTDGSNHDACCLSKDVNSMCLPFCHNSVADIPLIHFIPCYTSNIINKIFSCFASGSELLPGPPERVTALAEIHGRQVESILIKWSQPLKNPSKVTGYIIMYKASEEQHYKSLSMQITDREFRLEKGLQPNTEYTIYVVAKAEHGVSFGSVEIDVFIPDSNVSTEQERYIDKCCSKRNVPDECRERLCSSRTWSQFSTKDLLSCSPYLEDVFSCLAGEQNHTSCCSAYDVHDSCLPLCSGEPPVFDESLINCVFDMNVVETCIQLGFGYLPRPPTSLTLDVVTTNSAQLSFIFSTTINIQSYVVQMKEGEGGFFATKQTLPVTQNMFRLNKLKANMYYSVRVVTEANEGSLPSDTVTFLTLPESMGPPDPPVVNIANDMKECCRNKGMPELCSQGCEYRPNMTSYFANHLDLCLKHSGSVLSCASDGRDHSACCEQRLVTTSCVDLCRITQDRELPPKYYPCVPDIRKAVLCFIEGITHLPRHPDVDVTHVTDRTITLEWKQPKTSGLIDYYIVRYGLRVENKTTISTNNTFYILQNLHSGAGYEISVTSVNENGTSVPSPTMTVFTKTDFKPSEGNTTLPTGRALWENIEHCCENSGVSQDCMDICNNSVAVSGAQLDNCQKDHHRMLACFNNGQDHSVCCESKNLLKECLPLCAGHPMKDSVSTASCISYGSRGIILGCILENNEMVPLAPSNLLVKLDDQSGNVAMSWASPTNCQVCQFTVHYWKKGEEHNVTVQINVVSPLRLTGLTQNIWYVFTVSAQNQYGAGAPAPWVDIYVPMLERDVKIILLSKQNYVERGDRAILVCSTIGFSETDPPVIEWYFNRNRKLQGQTKRRLLLPNVNPDVDEGYYMCQAKDSYTTSSARLYLPIQYPPKMFKVRDDDVGTLGETSKIVCWFKGYPDSDKFQWRLNDVIIHDQTGPHYSVTSDSRYHTGITTYRIRIYNMMAEDYGVYSINVHNKFGKTSCTVQLEDPSMAPTPSIPARKSANTMKCCKDNGVTGLCQKLCTFNIDIASVVINPKYQSCLLDFETLIKCGADERDHTNCCKDRGVEPYCLPFCNGNVPGSVLNDTVKMLTCLSEAKTTFRCIQRGHDLIPYPPLKVHVEKASRAKSLIVLWSPPLFNHDFVEHYNVHINTSDPALTPEVHSVTDKFTQYVIQNIRSQLTYYVYVESGNKHGTSHPSNTDIYVPLVLRVPRNVVNKHVSKSMYMRISWEVPLLPNHVTISSYSLMYKKKNDVRFTAETMIKTTYYLLKDLESETMYTVNIVAVMSDGQTSEPSQDISFTTGKTADTSPIIEEHKVDNNKVAIGVGVAVALIALVAIVLLILFFVFRGRIKSSTPITDTVTFENPGYGTSENIKIQGLSDDNFNYGRLQENTVQYPYDNSTPGASQYADESSTDPQPSNPDLVTQQQESIEKMPATLNVSSNHLTHTSLDNE